MSEKPPPPPRLFAWAIILSTLLALVIGFGFGVLYTELRGYHQQYLDEREQIEPILASDPAFREVWCSRRSDGGVYLFGSVPTKADRDRLRERIVRVVGEKRADDIMYALRVFRKEKL